MAKAKRGDLAFLRTEHSYTLARGGTRRWTEYTPGVVTSVTRDGMVKALRDARGTVHKAQGAHFLGTVILPARRLVCPVEDLVDIIARVCGDEPIKDLEEMRTLAGAYTAEPPVETLAERLGYSIAGANVVLRVDGRWNVAVPLPGDRAIIQTVDKVENIAAAIRDAMEHGEVKER